MGAYSSSMVYYRLFMSGVFKNKKKGEGKDSLEEKKESLTYELIVSEK